jgi:hypothetical protein
MLMAIAYREEQQRVEQTKYWQDPYSWSEEVEVEIFITLTKRFGPYCKPLD